jgi:hypothetical protein
MSLLNVNDYLKAILFAETDRDGSPLDRHYSIADFSPCAVAKAKADIAKFEELAGPQLEDYCLAMGYDKASHDLWFSRAGHGTGFWDVHLNQGEVTREIGKALHAVAKTLGEQAVYVGDDGMVYFHG